MTDATPLASEQIMQEDREAAADAVLAIRVHKDGNWQGRIRKGECDDGVMVQAFARHRIAALSATPAPSDIRGEASFLCDRLREFERDLLDDEAGRQYCGHVTPSLERLEALLDAPSDQDASQAQAQGEVAKCLTPGCKYRTEIKTSYAHSSYGNARLGITAFLPDWQSLKVGSTTEVSHIEAILHTHMERAVSEIGQYDLSLGGAVAKDWPVPPAPGATAQDGVERLTERVAEVMDDDGGCWSPCSGCQESNEGYVSERDYPYSPLFKCQPGGGCRECGGIGVLWQDGAFLASYGDALSEAPTPTIPAGMVAVPRETWDAIRSAVGCGSNTAPSSVKRIRKMMDALAAAPKQAEQQGVERPANQHSAMEVELLSTLAEVELELRHCRVFISSREKMHPTGIELYDQLHAKVNAALNAPTGAVEKERGA